MAIISDNQIDHELAKMKGFIEGLKKTVSIFSATHKTLPARERALTIQKIQSDIKTVSEFLQRSKSVETYNSGTKFGLETAKNSLASIQSQWKRIEKALEDSGAAGTTRADSKSDGPPPLESALDLAVQHYEKTLRSLGHQVDPNHVAEFKQKLNSAVAQRSQKTGQVPEISLTVESGKVKVKLS
ncbi:MAG: hypothetical protein IT289_02125 [Oligoflexia bacterium]|nr:hypothetical protein [Oligoflexia bacterium]